MSEGTRRTERIEDVISVLQSGGIALLPTDTVYGLAVKPMFEKSVKRLFSLKARPFSKSLPLVLSSPAQLFDLGAVISQPAEVLMKSPLMPGALTLVVEIDPDQCPAWLKARSEIAFRIPDDGFLRDILARTGPLFMTSANLSGEPTPTTLDEVLSQLDAPPGIAVAREVISDIPSTLVNCRHSPASILRLGAIARADLEKWIEIADV